MTDPTTLFLISLFLLLACAVFVGELFSRLGQAALVGQILVGVILGPTVLGPYIGLPSVSTELSGLQVVATFFILMMAGIQVTPAQIRNAGVGPVLLGLGIFVIPFVLGAAVVHLLFPSFSNLTTLFVSLTISITALPVLAIMLRDFDLMRSRLGPYLINASVVNELAAVTVFAVLLRIQSGGANDWVDIGVATGTVLLFLGSVLAVYLILQFLRRRKVWERLADGFHETWRSREAGLAVLIVAALGAALYSQLLGLTFIVGAFYAGMLVTPESAGRRQHREISVVFDAVTWGFFIPIFFALVGFGTDFRLLGPTVIAVAAFSALALYAIFSKVFVGSAVARTLGWSGQEAYATGFLLTSRGAVELAMAVILLNLHIFTTEVYTVVAGVGLITTLISPIGARPFVRQIAADQRRDEEAKRWARLDTFPSDRSGGESVDPPPL
jgi:Kef-type K+ transport system membrane component KefB